MKKWILRGLLFFSSYLVFVVASMPINTVLAFVTLPKGLTISGVSGTIWQTKIAQVNTETVTVNRVNAHLKLSSLFLLNPTIEVNFGGRLLDGPHGNLTVSGLLSRLEIKQTKLTLPANDIAQQLILPIDLTALGSVTINLDHYLIGKPLCKEIQGNIVWSKAAMTAFEQTVELGRLQGKLSCKKGAVVLKIDDKNNLGLSFSAYLRAKSQVSGNGYLTPGSKFPPKLKELLPFIGKADRQGRYRLRF